MKSLGKKFCVICFAGLILPGLFLRCHVCPPNQQQDLSACIAHSPQECKYFENACFFEYRGRIKNMGCGRDWHKPAGCHGHTCVKWCHSDMCNKELIRNSPFRNELGEDNAPKDSGNWFTSLFGGSSMSLTTSVCCTLITGIIVMAFL